MRLIINVMFIIAQPFRKSKHIFRIFVRFFFKNLLTSESMFCIIQLYRTPVRNICSFFDSERSGDTYEKQYETLLQG